MFTTYKNKELRKIEVETEWKGKFKTTQSVRGFSFTIDEPEKLGGDNTAPTPLEYVLGAFNGCIFIVIDMVAKEISFQYEQIDNESTAWVDRRGLFGTADVSPYYKELKNSIVFYSDESEDRLEELKRIVLKRCPLYNLLKDAGVEIQLDWKLQT
jgi:uncharacterized OsmC-like protein